MSKTKQITVNENTGISFNKIIQKNNTFSLEELKYIPNYVGLCENRNLYYPEDYYISPLTSVIENPNGNLIVKQTTIDPFYFFMNEKKEEYKHTYITPDIGYIDINYYLHLIEFEHINANEEGTDDADYDFVIGIIDKTDGLYHEFLEFRIENKQFTFDILDSHGGFLYREEGFIEKYNGNYRMKIEILDYLSSWWISFVFTKDNKKILDITKDTQYQTLEYGILFSKSSYPDNPIIVTQHHFKVLPHTDPDRKVVLKNLEISLK